MKGDIALAGFMLTAEEWRTLDSVSRAELVAAATRREDGWVVAPVMEVLAEGSGARRDDER